MDKSVIARDILNYCRKYNVKFFVVKYRLGEIVCSDNGKVYSPAQLGQGLSNMRKMDLADKISKSRWIIYEKK